jgi:hypothetical protein
MYQGFTWRENLPLIQEFTKLFSNISGCDHAQSASDES